MPQCPFEYRKSGPFSTLGDDLFRRWKIGFIACQSYEAWPRDSEDGCGIHRINELARHGQDSSFGRVRQGAPTCGRALETPANAMAAAGSRRVMTCLSTLSTRLTTLTKLQG